MRSTRMATVIGAMALASLGVLAGRAEARVGPRVERIRYEENGGFAGIQLDLKVYTNREAVLRSGFNTAERPKTLRLTEAEYDSLLKNFQRIRFNDILGFPIPRHIIADGMRYEVTLRTPRQGNPAGVAHTVHSQTGAFESAGFRALRERLHRLAYRVAEEGSDGQAGLKASLSARQLGGKVRLEFKVTNTGPDSVNISYRHLNHWAELEAWSGGQRVWTWSANKRWPMVMVAPKPLAPGKSLKMSSDEFDVVQNWPPHILSMYASFTFKGTSFGPARAAQKTLKLAMPLRRTAEEPNGQPSGGPGILDGLNGGR
ncbi:MAG: hypothetical protein HYZ53_05625 [Planctomycetes bacterium]|nr:hypothetical protein [Planctomycetota bacterium]